MAQAKISFYSIESCGYFLRGNPNSEFGDCTDLFEDFFRWLTEQNLTLRETQTYLAQENNELLPTYRLKISKVRDNEYLLALWNEIETSEGKLTSISGDTGINDPVSVNVNAIPRNNIPGFSTYFWILPEKRIISTIQFSGRVRGMKGLKAYLFGYLEKFSSWVQIEQGEERSLDVNIIGYRNNDTEFSEGQIFPRFEYRLLRHKGDIEYIREHREKITKLIKKDRFNSVVSDEESLLKKMLVTVGIQRPVQIRTSDYSFKLDFNPNEEDLNRIIDHWDANCSWSDVGFKIKGESSPRWLSHSEVKGDFDLDVTWSHEGTIINMETFVSALNSKRSEILGLIES